ncbi:DUF2058 domain-containing protein [Colwellia sp. UCD-KL20]|uniref:DUF2058 domain-containing protein n=1 Tax=Colwellia sp. UCD-KL20 TaxID=1917165 RepID=UPI0009712D14|nr:DUF2058 domain-containing protein [Colwellia sp. UCD-KL20]
MASLQDQLLKAGLTTKQKARQANSDQRKKNKQKRSGVKQDLSLQEKVKQDLAKSKEQKAKKDAELNAEKNKQLAQKETHLRILQILQHHKLTRIEGETEYNYTFNNKVKKLLVDVITHKALVNGRLAICGLDDTTYVVTSETAEKIATLDSSIILVQNDKVETNDVVEDDPYAEFQIPDDLMW